MRVHLCILSQQVLQNILPLCRLEADYVYLAASEEMIKQSKDKQFRQLLVDLGIVDDFDKVRVLDSMPSYKFEQMRKWALQQMQFVFENVPKARIVLNATGGTKLMSLALIDVCRELEGEHQVDIIYCDTINDQLENIYPVVYTETLASDLLKTKDIIKAHSIRINRAASAHPEWQKDVETRRELSFHLGQHMGSKLGSFIATLNKSLANEFADKLEETHFPLTISLGSGVSKDWNYVLRLMDHLELIKLKADLQGHKPAVFSISSLEAARYLHGGWLEEYLWLCFKEAGISDVQSCVQITSLHDNVGFKDNELDLIASNRNNLVIVECKTANMSHQQVLNRALDKLSALSSRSGGLLAERWFATARWPQDDETDEAGNNLAEKFRLQAKDQNVVLIEPRHLNNLVERLKVWKKTSRFPLQN
ncbi:MAG: DUF1887 family CARF protein [Alcaligenaceae bacterium]|nr:DUF1887 family CARF protein [Alcaligenaceae bacterium]